jgi:hypothetical protein
MQHRRSGIKTHLPIQNMFISSHEIEHSFSNRLNGSYTDNHAIVQNDNSAIQEVLQILFWYTPHLTDSLISSYLSQLSNLLILVPLTILLTAHIFRHNDDD